MKRIFTLIVTLLFIGCSGSWGHKGLIKLEFRVAETTPAVGLQEMSMLKTAEKFYVHDQVLLTNDDIQSAVLTQWQDRPAIQLNMTESGRVKFAQITEQNIGNHIGMILDGKLVSAPLVRAKIDVGIAMVNGIFTEKEAREIAAGLCRE
jgi:preprotein translocase subunit SecD